MKSSNGSDGDYCKNNTSDWCSNDLPYWQIHVIQASCLIAAILKRCHLITSSKFSLYHMTRFNGYAYKIGLMVSFI